ncbi:DUF2637 domain-containing protein [Streptomyces sp. 8L]|uniref:DUF2637 domain-containing protein n=1 Tax=Streptomyces sp. 8L TaxID=2877242 RepID=UPI001CD35C20|nr:DUF2637 domain-containing protein [Streptomyces sp. 8L]MCA1219294.1 DUF2637 domain-containing protein [Streptomyces sp. 8L]
MRLGRTHRILVGVVITGAVIIAGIGFAGSYAAVRALAESKGFGEFALVFPIGIDAGICVLLALDLLLTWIRIPFPLLRQAAWVLTAATIAFNGAAAWPDPLGVGMHAVIPLLFIVTVEAARHAVGRIADITADKHMEGVRLTRWLLSPVPTFLLWRRMKLWELRSYEQVIKLEQDRLIYQSRLQARFGRGWRRKAPVESLMPLRLAKYGVPLADTASDGLAAAGIETTPAFTPAPGGPPTAVGASSLSTQLEMAAHQHQSGGAADQALAPGHAREGVSSVESPRVEMPSPARPQAEARGVLDEFDTPPTGAEPGVAPEPQEPAGEQLHTPEVYAEAFTTYLASYGETPNARQFALHLLDRYGIRDESTGGPLPEQDLRPLLQELRHASVVEHGIDAEPAESRSVSLAGDDEHPFFGGARRSDASPRTTGDLTGAVASPAAEPVHARQEAPTAGPASRTAAAAASSPSGAGEAGWADTAAGTSAALLPQHQEEQDEDESGARLSQVIEWLSDAEAAGRRLSGAEVARRLGVSPSTGQRAVREAKAHRDEQQASSGRGHLRSVSSRP